MRSNEVKKGFDRAPHRSLLRATGQIQNDDDFSKPFIGIANSYIDLIPGHVHLKDFGPIAKSAVRESGGVPFEFNTTQTYILEFGHQYMRVYKDGGQVLTTSVTDSIK